LSGEQRDWLHCEAEECAQGGRGDHGLVILCNKVPPH
jgi:hypothetical protein